MNAHESEHENENEREVVPAIALGYVGGYDLRSADDGSVDQPLIPKEINRLQILY